MARKVSRCPHITNVGSNSWEDIWRKKAKQETCMACHSTGPNLWLCIHDRCLYVGCGETHNDHSSFHAEEAQHCLTLNMTTMRVWCYTCECEVYREDNEPPLILRSSSSKPPGSHFKSHTPGEFDAMTITPEDTDSDDEDLNKRPRGLTGLQNIGNTCYMNAALQCLSNCPPLTQFFLDCRGFLRSDSKPQLSMCYQRLISDMWHKKRPSYIVPSSIAHGIKILHPMFKGYTQQDSQEFLRCFMDDLHEELKQPLPLHITSEEEDAEVHDTRTHDCETSSSTDTVDSTGYGSIEPLTVNTKCLHPPAGDVLVAPSDTDYETCDSGMSSDRSSVEPSISDDGSSDGAADNAGSLSMSSPHGQKLRTSPGRIIEPQVHSLYTGHAKTRVVHSNQNNSTSHTKAATSPTFTSKQLKDRANRANRHTGAEADSSEFTDAISELDPLHGHTTAARTARSISPGVSGTQTGPATKARFTGGLKKKKRKERQYQSVISDVFDGRINSSVQCLTCEQVSSTRETFQDLSLPIPSKDHLQLLHASQNSATHALQVAAAVHKGTCGEVSLKQTWFTWMFGWMKSLFMGPMITLQDCLAAFFSADELKGDNMYSCEKCKKLRNGVKYSKVVKLPEVLCIHLKRFRHEFMFSSKIASYVSFPMEGLDMTPYLHKDCRDQITIYDLVAVICHHGTAGGGHYTSYGLNNVNMQWYEFDDQYVTEVDMQSVENSEVYVLFYRKRNEKIIPLRQKADQLMESKETSMMNFYVSKQWINRFNTFAEPGPITNYDFLCRHGGIGPNNSLCVSELTQAVPRPLWQMLHDLYGGGPAVNHIYQCNICLIEQDKLQARQKNEMETFIQLNSDFQNDDNPSIYAISIVWFKQWETFVRGKSDDPPGPIENYRIALMYLGHPQLKVDAAYGQLSDDMWRFLHGIYGGNPEIILKQKQVVLATQQEPSGGGGAPTLAQQAAALNASKSKETFVPCAPVAESEECDVDKTTPDSPDTMTNSDTIEADRTVCDGEDDSSLAVEEIKPSIDDQLTKVTGSDIESCNQHAETKVPTAEIYYY